MISNEQDEFLRDLINIMAHKLVEIDVPSAAAANRALEVDADRRETAAARAGVNPSIEEADGRLLSEDEICDDCPGPDTYYGCEGCEDEDHFLIRKEQMPPREAPSVPSVRADGEAAVERVEHAVQTQPPLRNLDLIRQQMEKKSDRVGPVRGFTFDDTFHDLAGSPPPPPQVQSHLLFTPAAAASVGVFASVIVGAFVGLGAGTALRRRRRARESVLPVALPSPASAPWSGQAMSK